MAQEQRLPVEHGKWTMIETRRTLTDGWRRVAKELQAQGEHRLVERLHQFLRIMPPVVTDRERTVLELVQRVKALERQSGRNR